MYNKREKLGFSTEKPGFPINKPVFFDQKTMFSDGKKQVFRFEKTSLSKLDKQGLKNQVYRSKNLVYRRKNVFSFIVQNTCHGRNNSEQKRKTQFFDQ